MYLRGEPHHLHEDWLKKSGTILMDSVLSGHTIPDRKTVYFNLLNNFNVGFTLAATYLLSFLGILALLFFVHELAYKIRLGERTKIKLSKRIALTLNKFQKRTLSAIGVFVLFTHLFLWLTQLFLTNNIKTNKVVSSNSILN